MIKNFIKNIEIRENQALKQRIFVFEYVVLFLLRCIRWVGY